MQVWQDAQDLAVEAYRDFRSVQDLSFVDQIKRAVVSISNNIAEGSERTTPIEFARYLDIAKGSAGEVRSLYRLAIRLGYVEEQRGLNRCEFCVSISKQLAGFAAAQRRKGRGGSL